MLVNGSISYGERPGGSVLVSRGGSIAVSVKAYSLVVALAPLDGVAGCTGFCPAGDCDCLAT